MTVSPELPRDLPQLLSSVERSMTRRLAAELEAEGCSVEEWRVLSLLSDGRGHTMSDVAEYALMPAPSLTKLVDRLVSGALAYRRKDPGDGRRVLVYLSSRGRGRHRALAVPVQRAEEQMWAGLVGARDLADGLARLKLQLTRAPEPVQS
ncbi:MarR family winged helix-turn-helix transcriptional regulator [Streptomyces prunicolor]|uniref:MarR family winged helix-turn-helix transcriptional regulator n=1 Tax=Streptomyces prunicolor TaxID=67348 RepID=UPI00370F7DB7